MALLKAELPLLRIALYSVLISKLETWQTNHLGTALPVSTCPQVVEMELLHHTRVNLQGLTAA